MLCTLEGDELGRVVSYFLIRNREKFEAGGSLTLGIGVLIVLIRNCKKNRGGLSGLVFLFL
jgi:hypothetical protein